MIRRPPRSTLFPSPTLFRSDRAIVGDRAVHRVRLHVARLDALEPDVAVDGLGGDVPRRVAQRDPFVHRVEGDTAARDRKSTRLNSSHSQISYAVFCLKKKRE